MYADKEKLHEKERNKKPGTFWTILIDVTYRCNMNCQHCYAEPFVGVKPVEFEALKRMFEEAHMLGVSHYVLLGGEPIMDRERTAFILNSCYPEESYITVASNGWSMTCDTIRWLKELKVDKISVSLDSGIEEEHDANRRPGSFKRVMEAIDNILAEGLNAAIDVVVTHQSLYSEGFKKAYEYSKAKGVRLDLQIAEPIGKWDGRKDVLITPEDAEYIKKLQTECPVLPNGQRMIKRDIFNFGGKDHCPAGTGFLHITADGEVFPCNFLQFTLGNIRDKSLTKMRNDVLTNPWFNTTTHPCCLAGEDHKFIDTYIMPNRYKTKPLDAYAVFNLKSGG